MKMVGRLFCVLSVLILGTTLSAAQLPAAMVSLRTKMKSAKNLEARFTQEVQDSLFPGDEEKAEGSLSFERPDHLVWTYQKPEPRVIRYQNRKLVIEEKGHHEVVEAQGSVTLEAAFSFLWGETQSELFVVEPKRAENQEPKRGDGAIAKRDPGVRAKGNSDIVADTFILKPRRKKDAQFRQIEFHIEKSLVTEARVTSLTDSVSVLKFSDWKVK